MRGVETLPRIDQKGGYTLPKISLKKFLHNKQIELQQTVIDLQDNILYYDGNEKDKLNLECAYAQLNLITEIINICNNRNRY